MLGVSINPPNADEAPNPTSSNNIHTTLGAACGAFTRSGHDCVVSSSVFPIFLGKASADHAVLLSVMLLEIRRSFRSILRDMLSF